jgi:hypothetical protein
MPGTKKIKRLVGPQREAQHLGKDKITCPSQDVLNCVKHNKDLTVFVPFDSVLNAVY